MSSPRPPVVDPARPDLPRLGRVLRRFGWLFAPHRAAVALAGAAMAAATACSLLQPWPIQMVLDGVLLQRRDRGLIGWLGPWLPDDRRGLLALCCLLLIVVTALQGLFTYLQNLLAAGVGHRMVADLRTRLLDRLQRLSLRFHQARRSGDLLMRLTGDVTLLREVLLPALLEGASRALVLAGMVALMAWMEPLLTLILAALLPLVFLTSLRLGAQLRQVVREQRRKEGKIAALVGEALAAVAVIQAYSQERRIGAGFARQNRRSLKAGLRSLRLEERLARAVELSLAAGTAAVLFLGGLRALGGQLSLGELTVFLAYLRGVTKPIQTLARLAARAHKAAASGERILEVLDSNEQVEQPPDALAAPPLRGAITLEQVSFGYLPSLPRLQQVSIRIEPGEWVGLVGPSGAGKSTVLALLLRLYDPETGRILADGVDLRRYTLESYRRQVAVVFQEPHLFGVSVADNIAFGRPDASRAEIEQAGRLAGAHEFITALAHGYDTLLGERGASLSRGQQQRLAIARAVLRDAPILVLDEPTTGLDSATELEVRATLRRLARHRTCVWIDHRLDSILDCPRVIVLQDGRVVEDGPPARLLQRAGHFQRLFRGVA